MKTAKDFDHTLRNARRGERFIYHVGLLMADRLHRDPGIREIAGAAWHAYEAGKCLLVQRRVERGCEYIAVRL